MYNKLLKKINKLSLEFKNVSDNILQNKTKELKERIERNDKETSIIIEAFAVVREADKRVLGLYPTDEQILGALALYFGNISEMKTGEGKSLVATLPLYLKTLYLGTVFLVTTNDYLAKRDYERIGKVYQWLGLIVADGSTDPDDEIFDVKKRKAVYDADIIYISNGTLGFDYLIDGLAERQEEKFLPELTYAILDEVDEILLDSAQMPLIISGAPKVQSNYFLNSNSFVSILNKEKDFKLDEEQKNVWLTERGIEKAKKYFAIPKLLSNEYFSLYQHIILALKAHHTLKFEKDYLIEDGKVKLLDRKDGRILEGSNLQNGLHQAIEAKESVEISNETQVISSITYQNLFRQFKELSGMSGTAKVAEDEFINTYNLPVKVIKTHKKSNRVDHKIKSYTSFSAKLKASIEKISSLYTERRPILVITGSVDASELYSMNLLNMGIPHNILNAKSSSKESQIIKEAGQVGSVTIATSMAGRGTDIKISEQAVQKGGLAVVITERMINKRIELQAKGRAGRQGEPGDTYTYECLEDSVIKNFVQDSIQHYYDKYKRSLKPIKNHRVKNFFNKAQEISEQKGFDERLRSLQFDDVLRLQKEQVDKNRKEIIEIEEISEALMIIKRSAKISINKNFSNHSKLSSQNVQRFILDTIDYNFKKDEKEKFNTVERVSDFIEKILESSLRKKREMINDDEAFLQYLRITMLKAVDTSWSKQVDTLNQLRFVVQSRSTAQKKPITEFEKEALKYFKIRQYELANLILRNSALSLLDIRKGELIVTFP
ncbi:preprotein translocase subunit SecA [Lactococcus lactis]|uniref:preprotein translocase subunit SecA n=1 Tax=Lactococcus lactis TaxID=1358 RepID=UPI00288E31CB|nr:preprotein translocase subunit SecA [Lactococcus lactis]MDT2887974.1 preprotein translocase subunit SecA [Lactococcus lactis]MDT2930754.1 preprotein translocase subunit SecA [Lactococcus lactis]